LQVQTKMEPVSCVEFNFKALCSGPVTTRKWQVFSGSTLIDIIGNKDTVLNYRFKSAGTYFVKYSASYDACPVERTDTVIITNATPLNVTGSNDTAICSGNSVVLNVVP